MCKFKQTYKNVPEVTCFVKAGRRLAKRMEPHKFVDTNLLIILDHLKMGNAFALRMMKVGIGSKNFIFSKTCEIKNVVPFNSTGTAPLPSPPD